MPKQTGIAAAAALACAAAALAGEAARTITWEDLSPPGEAERQAQFADTRIIPLFEHGGAGDLGTPIPLLQSGSAKTVAELDGVRIAIEGYVVPFDLTDGATTTEFLLVPYYGACIHVPPPPPNQVIYVKSAKPVAVGRLLDPARIEGVLAARAHMSDVGDAAYTLTLTRFESERR